MRNNDISNSIDTTLSGLSVSKSQGNRIMNEIIGGRKVKAKLSAGLLLSFVLLLLVIGSAFALVRSGILGQLYGSESAIPLEAQKQLVQPGAAIQGENGVLVLNEYLFTGDCLYLHWSLLNPTDQQYMYTMTEFRMNSTPLSAETEPVLLSEAFGYGQLLGGNADGAALANSIDLTACYQGIGRDTFSAIQSSLEGETITLSCQIGIWVPCSEPILAEKGYTSTQSIINGNRLPTDATGFCDLSGFIPDQYFVTYSAAEHENVYRELGWVKRLETVDCSFDIELDSGKIHDARPLQTVFELQDRKYQIETIQYSIMGGSCILRMYAPNEVLQAQRDTSITMLDAKTKQELTSGSFWGMETDEDGITYISYHINLIPPSGALPDTVLIVPRSYQPAWDPEADNYDPTSINPVNQTYWLYDMDHSVRVSFAQE